MCSTHGCNDAFHGTTAMINTPLSVGLAMQALGFVLLAISLMSVHPRYYSTQRMVRIVGACAFAVGALLVDMSVFV